jgi:hypothetical protein
VAIGKQVASLIPDGATLQVSCRPPPNASASDSECTSPERMVQMGIGSIPNAVLNQLTGHKDLGIHSELFSDGEASTPLNCLQTGTNRHNL